MKLAWMGMLYLSWTVVAAAQESEPRAVTQAPVIDGRLNEDVWNQALVITDFHQRFPREGGSPTERTEVRMVYTPDALYIGFRAHDTQPARIEATVMRRDDTAVVNNDQFAIAIDSQNDGRSGFWFSTNPLGVRVDAQFFDEGDLWEANWNGIWECRTSIDSEGWTAEIEIPFSTLRFPAASEIVMGINLFRRIIRTNEALFSPMIPLSYSNGSPNVSIARKYRFHGIRAGKHVHLKPYLLSGLQSMPDSSTDSQAKAGLDLQYPITSGFTSYFSLNTDFAEAEADELQVNLTRYPLFYPEKRDFFLENAGDFSFGVPQDTEIFFSRRIGLSDAGEPVPVLFGARAAGRMKAFDLGLINVQTREDGLSPAADFSAARFRASIAPRSYVGGIYTGRYENAEMQSSFGGDFLWYFGQNINMNGFASGISRSGAPRTPAAYYLNFGRGGEATAFHVSYLDVSKQFDPAVGFVRRTDIRNWSGSFALPLYWNSHHIRNVTPGIQAEITHDHGAVLLDSAETATLDVVLQSEDSLSFYVKNSEEFVPEAFPVFQDVLVAPGRYKQTRAGITASTKPGRPFSASITFATGGFYGGSLQEFSSALVYRANRNLQFTQSLSTNFADLKQNSFHALLSRSRIDWTLNTKLAASALLQYDNDLQQTAVNLRVSYLFREGTQLFIVYDHGDDNAPYSNNSQRRLLVKLTYLF